MKKALSILVIVLMISTTLIACKSDDGQIMDGRSSSDNNKKTDVVETKDLSTDRPKTIESSDLKYFTLRFENNYGSYGMGDEWPSGYYNWEIDKRDGVYMMSLQVTFDSHLEMNYFEEVEESYMQGLCELIQEMKLPEYNGYYMTDNGNGKTYFLNARYTSGEELTIQAEGKVADTCVFDIPRLMEYAAIKTSNVSDDQSED